MGYFERQGHDSRDQDRGRWERRQKRHELGSAWDPRERPWGDEDFDQDRERWREPMEFEPRSGRLQWGGESLDRGYYPRRQSHEFEPERYPREQHSFGSQSGTSYGRESWGRYVPHPREWWREENPRMRGPHVGKGPKGYRRSDERILEDVNQALHDAGAIDASEIEVSCKDGEILLCGSVADRRAKRIAEEIAEEQSGVHDVRNEIRVSSQSRSEYGQPSFAKRETER